MSSTTTKKSVGAKVRAGELRKALSTASPAVGGRGVAEVMHGVLLSPNGLSCTDGEIRIDVSIETGVNCVVPHARLLAIVNACGQDDEIVLSENSSACVVSCENGKWTLPSISASEFPEWGSEKTAAGISLPCDQLANALTSVLVAADRGSAAMAAVVVGATDGAGTFAAMDGHRLAIADIEHGLAIDDSTVVIPSRAAAALVRIASAAGGEEEAQFRHSARSVRVSAGNAVMFCRQIAAQLPDYRKIKTDLDGSITVVDRSEFGAACRAAAAVASETSRGVNVVFSESGVALSCKSSEYGSSKVTCPVFASEGTPEFRVNPWYMIGWLAALPAESDNHVEVAVVAGNVVMRCGEYRTVIMPLAE